MLKRVILGLLACVAAVYVFNASWRVTPLPGAIKIIAHRGVHQNFDSASLGNDGCSAVRIEAPTHTFLENTIPSMRAAFAAGADVVEFDVHPTTDGRLAVYHDWTIDCRTQGTGVTREQDMTTLKALDIGYGYTSDDGATYPFRGKGNGMMPEISEVLTDLPEGRFLVNFKSREAREGDMLADVLNAQPDWRDEIWEVYGGSEPTWRARDLLHPTQAPDRPLVAFSSRGVKDCLLQYLGLGWTGYMPDDCRNTAVMVPLNYAWLVWGWPNLFVQRMAAAGSSVILLGPLDNGEPGTDGIDTAEELAQVPSGFSGYIWTNRIERIGPMLKGNSLAKGSRLGRTAAGPLN